MLSHYSYEFLTRFPKFHRKSYTFSLVKLLPDGRPYVKHVSLVHSEYIRVSTTNPLTTQRGLPCNGNVRFWIVLVNMCLLA